MYRAASPLIALITFAQNTYLEGPLHSVIEGMRMNQNDMGFLKELLEAGKIKPIIDRRYSLSEVAEVSRYFEEGHAKGKVVITVEHGE